MKTDRELLNLFCLKEELFSKLNPINYLKKVIIIFIKNQSWLVSTKQSLDYFTMKLCKLDLFKCIELLWKCLLLFILIRYYYRIFQSKLDNFDFSNIQNGINTHIRIKRGNYFLFRHRGGFVYPWSLGVLHCLIQGY